MTAIGLEVSSLIAKYGHVTVLHNISLSVPPGTTLGIVGPNGAGKTALLSAISGLLPSSHGEIVLGTEDVTKLPTHKRVARGLTLVPEGRQVFASLSVQANLDVTIFARGLLRADKEHQRRLEGVFDLFPVLAECRQQNAGLLSGGQQQMLALGRALMTAPRVLLIDEPTQGLAPRLVDDMSEFIRALKSELTMVIVEQRASFLDDLVDAVLTMRLGRLENRSGVARSESVGEPPLLEP